MLFFVHSVQIYVELDFLKWALKLSIAPSAVSFISYSLYRGYLMLSKEIEELANRLSPTTKCVEYCPFNINPPELFVGMVREIKR